MTAPDGDAKSESLRAAVAPVAFPAATGAVLALLALLLAWNVFQYDWLRSFDAEANARYADVLHEERRMPRQDETTVWHTPPLFFALAGELQALAKRTGWPEDPHTVVQLLSVLAGVGLAAFALLTARELFPRSRTAQLAALAVAAATPVLARASILYHPEPLAALLAAAGGYVLVRALARNRPGVAAGAGAGVLLGLANLTRTWALAALAGAVLALAVRWLRRREPETLRMTVALVGAAVALVSPWLAFKTARHGSPLAFSRPNPAQWVLEGRPAEFYTGLPLEDVFGHPYAPAFRNLLLPVVYTDWWGDYHRYYGVPPEFVEEPERLPDEYHDERVLQSYVGLLPSLLILVGIAALVARAVRDASGAALALVASPFLLALSFVYFLVEYPKVDGDNIKALYLLNAAVPLAVCAGWTIAAARRAGVLVFAALVLLLLDAAYFDLRFLILAGA